MSVGEKKGGDCIYTRTVVASGQRKSLLQLERVHTNE